MLAPPAPASVSDPCLSICPVCPCAYMWLLRVQAWWTQHHTSRPLDMGVLRVSRGHVCPGLCPHTCESTWGLRDRVQEACAQDSMCLHIGSWGCLVIKSLFILLHLSPSESWENRRQTGRGLDWIQPILKYLLACDSAQWRRRNAS